jgi:hypothetical protein
MTDDIGLLLFAAPPNPAPAASDPCSKFPRFPACGRAHKDLRLVARAGQTCEGQVDCALVQSQDAGLGTWRTHVSQTRKWDGN